MYRLSVSSYTRVTIFWSTLNNSVTLGRPFCTDFTASIWLLFRFFYSSCLCLNFSLINLLFSYNFFCLMPCGTLNLSTVDRTLNTRKSYP